MALAFVDLEKAFDSVPRKMAMATLKWMGTPDSEVKMVGAMHENTKGNIGLIQGSALTPLLFILVMELISRNISTTDALRKIVHADDLVIVAENWEELQDGLDEWNDMFKKRGLKINHDKTEVMWVRETEREVLKISLEGKDIKQVKNFVYLAGNIMRTGAWVWRFDAEYNEERMHGEM